MAYKKNNFNAVSIVFRYFSARAIPLWEKVLSLLLAGGYIILPFDLIFDFIPVVGWLDDIGIGALLLAYYAWRLQKIEIEENGEDRQDLESTSPKADPHFQLESRQTDNRKSTAPPDFFPGLKK